MKGNLNTLKKICRYASAAMLCGAVCLAALLAGTLALCAGAAMGDGGFSDMLSAWTGPGDLSSASCIAAVAEMVTILSLGLVTVIVIYRFMKAVEKEHSPFSEGNVDAMRFLSKTYLVFSVLLAIADWVARGSLATAMFMFFGSVMAGVVIYCLALAFRYGGVLQKESDETLRGDHGYNPEAGQGDGGQEDVPEPPCGEGGHLEREPVQHQDREDIRHKVLHPERHLQGARMPARGHTGVRGGRGGGGPSFRPPTPAPSPSSSFRTGRSP